MQTVIVELRTTQALKLLKDLEQANIIRLVKKPKHVPKKLSEQLWASIPDSRASEIQSEIEEMRNEWDRNI